MRAIIRARLSHPHPMDPDGVDDEEYEAALEAESAHEDQMYQERRDECTDFVPFDKGTV